MAKAGLFAGEVTLDAPANQASTVKQKGYQWMQYEIAPIPLTQVWVLNRGTTDMFYTSVDYTTGATQLGTKALPLNFPKSGFSSDGTYVLTIGDTPNDLAVLDWDGAVFTEIFHEAEVDFNNLVGLFGTPNNWMSPGAGSSGEGATTGSWTSGSISDGVTTTWTDALASWVLDFRSDAGNLKPYSGYGDMFIAGKFEASASEQIASFTLNDNGATAPTILDTAYLADDYLGHWGWDRDTGQFCDIDGSTRKIRYHTLDLSTGNITALPWIELVVRSATFYKGYLITFDDTRIAKSYSLVGSVPTLVDSIDLTTYINVSSFARIHTDPFSDYLYFTKTNDGAVAVEFLDDGTFNSTVVNVYTATTDWTDSVNGVYFLDTALVVTP